jgi:response regulator RpfG family c-di-GMP phosphodiesterase/signal transduction histidine kinase
MTEIQMQTDQKRILTEHFKDEILKNNISNIRITCIMAMIAIPFFSFLDYFLYRDHLKIFFILRIISTIPFVIVFLRINKSEFMKKHIFGLSASLYLDIGFTISLMIHMTEGYESPYYAGLVMVILILCIVLTLPLKWTIAISLLIYGSYITPILIRGNIADWPIFFNNNLFLIGMVIFAVFGARIKEYFQFNEFKSRYDIQKANEELKKLDELKSQFFANVSHEVRTPLTSILAPIETISQGDAGDLTKEQEDLIEQVHRNSLRLLDMINQMLDFSKIDAGQMKIILEKLDPTEIVRDMVAIFEEVAQRKGIELRFVQENVIPSFYLDKNKFERILTNLVRNALKFTEEGSILIKLRREKEWLKIEVKDTGIGIPVDHLPHIFERFRQVDGSSTRKFEGTGLGLTIVKECIDLMNGEVSAESELGKGTTFKVGIPLNLQDELKDAIIERRTGTDRRKTEKDYEGTDRREKSRRIEDLARITVSDLGLMDKQVREADIEELETPLPSDAFQVILVEDNTDLRMYISKMLKKFGHNVSAAADGLEGWTMIQEIVPDIVISDIMMPKMDGYELIKNVKSNQTTMHIPVMLITAKPELESKIKGLETGADDYLSKPVNIRELDARIRNLITLRKFQQAVAEAEALDTRIEELTMSFAQSLETRDHETAGHSRDVLELGTLIAEELKIPIDHELRDSLLLHDIGKLGVPDGILLKKGPLSKEEWLIMKKHPEIGANLLAHFESLKDVSHIIMAHQECYDGSGYPKGLKGEEIPLFARIIGVADAWHAMTIDRPYRKALEPAVAISELIKFKGKQFDPKIVDALIKGLKEKKIISEEDIIQEKSMIS